MLRIDPQSPDPAAIRTAADTLTRGALVAFPTETVYGLGANGLNPDAIARIYAAKGRPAWNPVILHVATIEAAQALTRHWSNDADRLARHFWPGPLTLVLPRAAQVPAIATAGLDAVGIRIPAHPVALALLQAVPFPIAAPSANRFTQLSPTTAAHVEASLGDRVPLILDGGPSTVGIESTVLDLCGATPTVLRPGMIDRAQLEAVLGRPVALASAATHTAVSADDSTTAPQRSPGMADRHYAPKADVWLVDTTGLSEAALGLAQRPADHGHTPRGAAVLLRWSTPNDSDRWPLRAGDRVVTMPEAPAEYARALYAALHEADATGAAVVVIEQPPATDAWHAIRDRLARAAR
jgi:L-threonylcarbamoyladenylate synthase